MDDQQTFSRILAGLDELAAAHPVVFPTHPRTQQRIRDFGPMLALGMNGAGGGARVGARHGIVVTDPLGYLDFLCLMKHASLVVTDSGGIQEETTCLGIPCVTVRENTERPVTVRSGTNTVAGTGADGIREAIRRQLNTPAPARRPEKWDGHAATRIVEILVRTHRDAR